MLRVLNLSSSKNLNFGDSLNFMPQVAKKAEKFLGLCSVQSLILDGCKIGIFFFLN